MLLPIATRSRHDGLRMIGGHCFRVPDFEISFHQVTTSRGRRFIGCADCVERRWLHDLEPAAMLIGRVRDTFIRIAQLMCGSGKRLCETPLSIQIDLSCAMLWPRQTERLHRHRSLNQMLSRVPPIGELRIFLRRESLCHPLPTTGVERPSCAGESPVGRDSIVPLMANLSLPRLNPLHRLTALLALLRSRLCE